MLPFVDTSCYLMVCSQRWIHKMTLNTQHCSVCGEYIPPRLPGQNKKVTCGKLECQKNNQKNYRQKYEASKQNQRRLKLIKNNEELIPCAICGELFEIIQTSHLKKHGMKIYEYREKFPDLPLMTNKMKGKRGKGSLAQSQYLTYKGKDIDDELHHFLAGTMLGDGSIERQKNKLNARYAEGGSNQKYMDWKYQFLKQYFHCTFNERISSPHVKSGKRYKGWWLRTAVHPELTYLHSIWYQDRKILPIPYLEEKFNEFSLALWFYDDGHYSRANNNIMLYTFSFSIEEVEWLSILLDEKYGILNNVLENGKKQSFIRLRSESVGRFIEIINDFKVPGMEYKYTK
ncbi:MAG: hypothetical protein RLZZ490_1974 [Cyanobacteriota bacterium]